MGLFSKPIPADSEFDWDAYYADIRRGVSPKVTQRKMRNHEYYVRKHRSANESLVEAGAKALASYLSSSFRGYPSLFSYPAAGGDSFVFGGSLENGSGYWRVEFKQCLGRCHVGDERFRDPAEHFISWLAALDLSSFLREDSKWASSAYLQQIEIGSVSLRSDITCTFDQKWPGINTRQSASVLLARRTMTVNKMGWQYTGEKIAFNVTVDVEIDGFDETIQNYLESAVKTAAEALRKSENRFIDLHLNFQKRTFVLGCAFEGLFAWGLHFMPPADLSERRRIQNARDYATAFCRMGFLFGKMGLRNIHDVDLRSWLVEQADEYDLRFEVSIPSKKPAVSISLANNSQIKIDCLELLMRVYLAEKPNAIVAEAVLDLDETLFRNTVLTLAEKREKVAYLQPGVLKRYDNMKFEAEARARAEDTARRAREYEARLAAKARDERLRLEKRAAASETGSIIVNSSFKPYISLGVSVAEGTGSLKFHLRGSSGEDILLTLGIVGQDCSSLICRSALLTVANALAKSNFDASAEEQLRHSQGFSGVLLETDSPEKLVLKGTINGLSVYANWIKRFPEEDSVRDNANRSHENEANSAANDSGETCDGNVDDAEHTGSLEKLDESETADPDRLSNESCSLDAEKIEPCPDFGSMDGYEFEDYCAHLLERNGFSNVKVTRGSGDQGVDVIAYRDGVKYGIQCKCYSSSVGNRAVQEVYAGKLFYDCHVAVIMTNSTFTTAAIDLAHSTHVVLWSGRKLREMENSARETV